MSRLEEIEKAIDKISKARDKAMNKFDFKKSESFQDWEDMLEPFYVKLRPLTFEREQLTPVEWKNIPRRGYAGDLFTLEEWIDCVKGGGFIDYDGSGNYSDGKRESNKNVIPSDVSGGFLLKNKEFTHVVWYNR
jgi:hypothetical protein